ncbi:MAG: cysteine desulfurase family protein [Melioribacteraceae bacterium]|nr:cysteine desulfurase family protein [Melioribacteraceae bacterium]
MKVYFDNAATTKVHPKVFESMVPYLKEEYGNPSSIHSFGRKVRVAIEDAREIAANYINANPSEIYFVSNGTEANNFPVFGIAETVYQEDKRDNLLTTAAEHTCVLEAFEKLSDEGFKSNILSVDNDSSLKLDDLKSALDNNTSLVSVIHINNETGTQNKLEEISEIVKKNNAFFHTDAVQSFGKIKIDVNELGVDALSASAHKFHGPKGVGLVYAKSGTPLSPMIFGGSQERNRRGGTEFAAGIIGLAEAIKIAESESETNFKKVSELRSYFIKSLKEAAIEGVEINCEENSFPYVLSITFNSKIYNNDSEAMLMFLDINGIAASNGAACTSGTLKPSHVIMSMGRSKEDANGTIRFSFSYQNTKEEVNYTVDVLEKMAKKFKRKN